MFPTIFRHQLCTVMHCGAKLQQTSSFRLYRSTTYSAPCASNQVGWFENRPRFQEVTFNWILCEPKIVAKKWCLTGRPMLVCLIRHIVVLFLIGYIDASYPIRNKRVSPNTQRSRPTNQSGAEASAAYSSSPCGPGWHYAEADFIY